MVKYLPSFGWQPTVFVPENPSYPIIDETLLSEVPPGVEVIKTKIFEPYALAEFFGKDNRKFKAGQFDVGENQSWKSKLSIWIRGNFFIPDARIFWAKPSVKFLKRYLAKHSFQSIVTTGPPHSLHLIGLALKKEFPHLCWIADFRDPWTEISYYRHLKLTAAADSKHRKLEAEVFKNADLTLATSFSDAENFRQKGANAFCLTNGFDGEISQQNLRTEKFTVSYVGVLEQLRNPDVLWQVLDKMAAESPEFKAQLEVKFVGRVDEKILAQIQAMSFSKCIRTLGYLPHDRAFDEMLRSDLLLVTNFPQDSSRGIIPGKIFEYLATERQILSFGPAESDVKRILAETGGGRHFSFEDAEDLDAFLHLEFHRWKSGDTKVRTKNIEQFSRKNLTKKLTEILENYLQERKNGD